MKPTWLRSVIATGLILFAPLSAADDTDLFVGVPTGPNDRPNVLFVFDNTANWSNAFENEKKALVSVFDNMPLDKFNVGIMMFGGTEVGYVRAAIRPMDAVNRPLYSAMIDSFVNDTQQQGGDRASARTLARTMSEVYRYLKGQTTTDFSNSGTQGNEMRDYTGNAWAKATAQSKAVWALPNNALNSATATVYNSPIDPLSCANTFVVYLGNTIPSGNVVKDNTSRNSAAGNELVAAGGDATLIPLGYTSHQDNFADEWARFLNKDLGVTVYTLDVDPTPMPGGHSNGMGNSALLMSMAGVGGGKYFRVDSSANDGKDIADALNVILSEIQSVNSVFAAVSLPVAQNTQGTYLNQVFIGMFRPDANALPRWNGNLKQYRIGRSGDDLQLLDANGAAAVNSGTNFLAECARSYWTPGAVDEEWAARPIENCLAVEDSDKSNYPDGNIVEKGGQAYVLRQMTPAARNVKTCTSTSCTSLVDLTTSTLSPAALGVATNEERDTLVNWLRGADIDDENVDAVTLAQMRLSAHGDVMHSRPVAINYGSNTAPDVAVYYGGNDGVLRAVNGNRTASSGSVPAGGEFWSFVPPEFFQHVKRLRDNDTTITYPGNEADSPLPEPKPYGFDGPMSAYQDGSTVYVYASMRRGGSAIYAFDAGTTANPSLLWRAGPEKAGFGNMGQSWSSPQAFKTDLSNDPLLIFGGGYDPCEDSDPNSCGGSPAGSGVYVVDAQSGNLLKAFTTERSVAADVFVVPDLDTGKALYAYVADTGGNLYRISGDTANVDFADTPPAAWKMTKIASLGCDTVGSCSGNRKFLHAPDVVLDGEDYIVLIGSGDREKPISHYSGAMSVENHFFMVRDRPTVSNWLEDETANCGSAIICLDSLFEIATSATPTAEQLEEKPKGWFLVMDATEQVVTSALTIFGTVSFSTHKPAAPYAPGVCTANLGTATIYNINYLNAAAANGTDDRGRDIPGGGLPPPPRGGWILDEDNPDGEGFPACFGCGQRPLDPEQPPAPNEVTRGKGQVYWKIQQ